jgi:hypothetical protein
MADLLPAGGEAAETGVPSRDARTVPQGSTHDRCVLGPESARIRRCLAVALARHVSGGYLEFFDSISDAGCSGIVFHAQSGTRGGSQAHEC